MNSAIAEAKSKLPLPRLMHQFGLGEHAKKSARCPFHDDQHNSFSLYKNSSGGFRWKCFAGCGEGDEISFLEVHEGLSNGQAIKRYLELAGVDGSESRKQFVAARAVEQRKEVKPTDSPTATPKAFDWQSCSEAFTGKHVEQLAEWRGYSVEFCSWLKENGLVGLYDGCIAFPIRDEEGDVVAAHYKPKSKDSKWKRYPIGFKTRPIIIGKLLSGEPVHIFESQWDAFAFMDKSGEHRGIVITLGSTNGARVAGAIPQAASLYVWPQNDAPGEKWARDVCNDLPNCTVKLAKTPPRFADLNEWTKEGGATEKDLLDAMVKAEIAHEPEPTVTSKSSHDDSEWGTDLSFTSLDEARFPPPLEDAAYYGLAGKIVQRILPETEADPAALLFTILAGFGNMIGRTAYMIADGARHYLNLFVVTVGRTSIARKRTAWVRVKPVLTLIDEDWVQKNVESGLSSGEGVIHRIRNKIDEEKPIKEKGKYTGQYETVTVDPGIDDKRLFVLETEFCSPLKVMDREGNTLSPVLRAAWDGDDLGTLTKNSRERATEPHFSLLGHITREELRRSLNETESGNGFGNRILWIGAKRSKSLPKGGQIPAIADFIEPLQDALLHAHTCGELKRDAEAEELWAQVYPELSEGKPGLFGAITARAAPQILRISGLYAVLDCSNLIRVPHLKAALACWRYAENSARWIFETGTGNKIADRILAALIAAGATGLSKTEIVCDVFNKNTAKFTIDEALRLLHHLKLADRRMETTKGRPAECWFFKSTDERNEINEQRGTV